MDGPPPSERVDKWLWQARFFKTRALSAKMISRGRIRVNARRVRKPATPVRIGDGLTFAQGDEIRVIRVLGFGTRRGPLAYTGDSRLEVGP
jgi:ribosome-associated heat shock protein Hsp15